MIADISLINSKRYNLSTPPAKLVIGIDIKKEAYYKLSDKENIIKGGLFYRGLNLVNIEADNFFEKSGSHIYFLDLKVGDLILRKEIEIDVQLDSHESVEKADDKIKNPEYKISMFIGDKLIISSKKLPHKDLSLKIEMPPQPENFTPFIRADKKDPALNSFSIFSALGLAYELIKNLTAKKERKKQESAIQKQKQIVMTFLRRDSEGVAKEVKAVITLKTRDIKIHLKMADEG